jgi:hypothetical protein
VIAREVGVFAGTFPVADFLAIAFGVGAAIHLVGPELVRRAYERWKFPPKFYRVTGIVEFLAAVFLAVPQTLVWGVTLAYLVTFVAVLTLLAHRQYLWSVPGMLLMVAIVRAALGSAPA